MYRIGIVIRRELARRQGVALGEGRAQRRCDHDRASARAHSGLFSANEDLRVRKAHRFHSPVENLAVSKKQGPLFCPGEAWRYTNTGYDLLGMIIERVDGRPYSAAIDARIIVPLGLKRLRVLRPGDTSSDVAPLISTKERPIDPTWPGAAGPIAASAGDMIRVWHALLTHRLLRADSLVAGGWRVRGRGADRGGSAAATANLLLSVPRQPRGGR